jgi:hypothetical protein
MVVAGKGEGIPPGLRIRALVSVRKMTIDEHSYEE